MKGIVEETHITNPKLLIEEKGAIWVLAPLGVAHRKARYNK